MPSVNAASTLAAVLLCAVNAVAADTYTLTPPDGPACGDDDGFAAAADALAPGDELIVSAGTYCQTRGRLITLRGTAERPIVIRAAAGARPLLTRPEDPVNDPPVNNNLTVIGEYAEIRGLVLRGGNAGLTVLGDSHHLTIADNEIAYTGNNALRLNQPGSVTEHIRIVGNHIHHTGLYRNEPTEGEGLYVGCNRAACVARYHLIEGNYVHDLRGTSGGGNDGIEIKYGSYGNVVRDNVIHTTTLGTRYPCIFVYGVRDPALQPPNIIDGNALWNCGEAVQAVADAVIVNNIVFASDYGITSYPHPQVPRLRRISIAGNTLAGPYTDAALLLGWGGARALTLADNAVYNDGGTAVDARWPTAPQTFAISANRVGGDVIGTRPGLIDAGAGSDAFVDAARRDVWPRPGGPLRGGADPIYLPDRDFNDAVRGSADIGAYDSGGAAVNPGWLPGASVRPLPRGRCRPVLTALAGNAPHPAGTTRGYRLGLLRPDSGCTGSARFRLAATAPPGWQVRFAADTLDVAAGAIGFADVTLRAPALSDRASTVVFSAVNDDKPTRPLRASLLIDSVAPETPLFSGDFEESASSGR